MFRTGRAQRWLLALTGAAFLLQAGTCTTGQTTLGQQLVLPALGNIVSDFIFFVLDNAFVHLTT